MEKIEFIIRLARVEGEDVTLFESDEKGYTCQVGVFAAMLAVHNDIVACLRNHGLKDEDIVCAITSNANIAITIDEDWNVIELNGFKPTNEVEELLRRVAIIYMLK